MLAQTVKLARSQSSTFPGQFTPGRLLLSRQHTEQCVSFCDQYAGNLVNSLSPSIPAIPRVSSNDGPHLVENLRISLKLALLLPSWAIKVSRLANDAFGGLHHCFGQSWMSVDGVREVSGGGSHFNGNDCFRDHFAGTRANKADA